MTHPSFPSQSENYRPEIDGLRAISIILILASHLGFSWAKGGFIGVDIFFVISGYVIHRGLLQNFDRNTFSVSNFYWRRFRRIIPGLVTVSIATVLAGFTILSPAELLGLSESAVAAIFFVANIHFNDQAGYFEPSATSLPLLHTWSLGVEEQFYILVPLLLYAGHKVNSRLRPATLIVSITALSFIYCLFETQVAPQKAFYLPMSRLWEIGAGGCVALLERKFASRLSFEQLIGFLGLGLIVLGVIAIDESVAFPGAIAGIPVLGSALIIFGGSNTIVARKMLALPLLVGIGRLSYSLYLVHWPLVVYWRILSDGDQSIAASLGLLASIFALAILLFQFVETPLRRSAGLFDFKGRCISAIGGLAIAICVATIVSNGWPQRMNSHALAAIGQFAASEENRLPCVHDNSVKSVGIRKAVICGWGASNKIEFMILGDSHASAMAPEVAQEMLRSGSTGGSIVSKLGCPPLFDIYVRRTDSDDCRAIQDLMLQEVRRVRPKVVILAARWANFASNASAPGDGRQALAIFTDQGFSRETTLGLALSSTVKLIEAAGARVVIVGPVPELNFDAPNAVVRLLWLGKAIPTTSRSSFDARQQLAIASIEAVLKQTHAVAVYPHETFCDHHGCKAVSANRSLYSDNDHLSSFGASILAPRLAEAVGLSSPPLTTP